MAFSNLRQIWKDDKAKGEKDKAESEGSSRGFVLTYQGIPYSRMAMPTKRLTDQKNPHEYVPACSTQIESYWKEK